MQMKKKIYRLDFLQINKTDFEALFIFIHVAMATAHQLSYQKSEVCVVNWRVAIFGDQKIKGKREKGD